MSAGLSFPFTAVGGSDGAKRALLYPLVNPRIKTVLIAGPAGTAKTVLARSLGGISGKEVVNLPLNATEEQIFGGMDIEETVRSGTPAVEKGLLSKADGNILYIDDANLLDRRLLASVLDCVHSGSVVLEREGVSSEYAVDTLLVATMNPVHSGLSPHILDRFDLCAFTDTEGREGVLADNLDFSEDPEGFVSRYRGSEEELRRKVSEASAAMSGMRPDGFLLEAASMISVSVGAEGSRGDLALVNSAMASAALDGRDSVNSQDIEHAASAALVHRRRYGHGTDDTDTVAVDPGQFKPTEEREPQSSEPAGEPTGDASLRIGKSSDPDRGSLMKVVDEVVYAIGEEFRVIDLFTEKATSSRRKTSARKGGRALVESSDGTGRYARSRIPEGEVRDLAFDATVRAAAPYQKERVRSGLSVDIREQDIRLKVRERRAGCTILFLVDSSGSIGLSGRMSAVKGAVVSMLRDSYVKRDRIGLMAFRENKAELILPPTKSVEYSYRMLANLPTGGRTPLGDALITVRDYMTSYSSSHPGEDCYIVLITDGIGNVPVRKGAEPNAEAKAIASTISIPQTRWIVIDTSSGLTMRRYAEELSDALGADYMRLKDLDADRLATGVRTAIGRHRCGSD